MANIRFKLLDDNESSQSNIRFKVIDNNQSNTTASLPQTNDNSLSTKKKKKNKKIVTDINLPIANNLKNIKMAEESNLPILPLNQSPQKSNVGKDISLPTFDITNNRTPELPKVLPQNVTPKEPSGSDEPSILKTALTGLNYLGQGVMKGAESLMDGAVQVATSNVNPYYWFNQDKLKQHQNIAQELIEKDATNNLITTLSGDENFNEKFLDKDSMITSDNLGGKVVTTIGQMMPAVMTGGGTAANLVLGMQSYGGGVEQAYNEGATRSQANLYGLGNAAIELGTEKLFGGIPGTKSNGWLDTLVARGLGEESFEEVSKSISKEIIKAGYKIVGEAGEEALAEIVNPILKNATYSEGEKVNWNNVLESAIVGGITGGILEAPSNISNIRTSASNRNNINMPAVNNIQNKVQNESQSSNVADSQAIALPEVKYQATISDNQKINNLRQSASNYFDNTPTTHDLINTIEKVITDKDYNIVFDNAIKNTRGESVNALISSNDGQIEIKLNPNSERAGEFLLMHEITHAIETDSMRQLVIDYASKNTQFNQVLENLKQSYGTNDVSDEVLADVSGQLFGNQEFINSLVIENTPQSKSMIRKIYESIVRTLNKLTTNGRYKNFVQELETKWREAYRNTTSEQTIGKLNNETKYMMTSIKGMQNGLSVNNRYQDIKDRYDKALQLETSGQYSNEDIRQETGWFKDKEGNWEFEISDQHTKFKVQPKANTKYKLPDIFEANTLYEMYPELKNITVEFKNLKGKNGNYNSIANKITINNAMINDLYNLKGTLLHEMQHYIQNEEGLPTGTTILFGNEQYANSKGEIEAADTKNRRNLTVEQRKSIIPESSKNNPIHPNRDAILKHKRNAVEKIAEQIYNIFGGNFNEISEEIDFQNIEQTNETIDKLYQENTNGMKELNNSSFSYDSEGRTLTKEQQEYFKDSKAKDENGNLITVYHTTTNRSYQFNEFNPVGTDYYKFGDQIVNYFTDDKEMSGSYADQDYTMADTTKISSMEEVEKLIAEYTQDTQYEGVELEKIENKYRIVDNSLKKAYPNAKKAYDKFTVSEKTNMYNVLQSIQNYIDRGYEGSYDKLDAETDSKLDEIRGELKTSEEREIFDELRKTNGEYYINDIKDKVLYEFENKDKLLKNIKESLQRITGKQQSNYQYEGYVNITNPYIIDAEGRNWNKIESKKDSATTEKMIYMDKLTKDRLSQLAKDSKNRYEKTYKEYQKWMDATNSIDGNLKDENTLEMRSANRIFREVYADGVKSFINNDYKSQLENGNDDSLNSLYEWRTNNDIMTKMCDWDLISPTEYEEFHKTLQVPDYIREKMKKLADTKVKYNEYDENGRNPILKEEKILKIWENYQEASKIYFNNGRYEFSIFDNQLLDGYLSEELKNSFPVRDEFGINDDYLKKLYKVASHDFDENYIRSEYNDWSVTNDIVKKIIELNKFGENYDGVIIKNTVDYGGKSEKHLPHDLYITFNSNQFKATDNTNPTSNEDIRYSQKNDKWQEYIEDNYKATGTRTKFEDIKIPIAKESKEINLPDKEYYLNKIKELESVNYSDLNPEGKKLYNEQMQKYKAVLRGNPTKAQSYDDVKLPTRKEVQRKYMNETDITSIDFDNAKKMSKFAMNRNTAIRLNEKIFGKNIGSKINEKFFYPIKKTESDRIRFLNSERNDIKSLGIKPKSIESSAVQKWGERKFVNDKGEYVAYTETMLMSDVPDAAMRDKVKKAAKTIRNKYDKYLESINNKLTENGYDPIPARDDYFMHFEELTDMFSQIGIPTKVNDLPTDINGVTDQFRPGKQFFANAMRREGLKTTYDAITGIDRYLEGASNVIYHTDDIQRLRTLEKYIRDTYGKENGLSEYENLTKEELIPLKDEYMDRLKKINSNHLSEYASWLQEYTNVLAGKKSVVDRSIESFFGRKVYKYLQFAKKQVGSNMTGFNIGSALTNFISGTQGMAKTNKKAFIQGTLDTIKNIFVKDNFIDKSDFLTTRFGSDKISKTTWEKISNAGQLLMSATDYFTANQIVRSKYHEYLQKGYTDVEAIRMADKFADKLMAGRGKGDMPNIFNSQMLGLVTQFQLEVNNQLDSMFYDTFTENYARNSKSNLAKTSPSAYNALGATFAFGQLLAFAYLFNNEYEKIVGRRPAFDIIDILMSAFEDMEDEEKDIGDVFGNIFNSLADNLPFVSTFTGGGRIPLSSALPNLSDLANGDSTLEKELKKPLYYLLPPTGGGQVKKTIEGLSMFSDDKEITGSYTDSGNLRFPVADTPKNRVQAALFGQYASENARKYFDEGYAPLKENQQKQYKELNIPISDYWKNKKEYTYQYNHPERYAAITAITDYNSYVGYNKEISNIKKKYEDSELRKKKVMEYIDSLDLTKIQKAIFKKLNYNSYSNYDSEIMRYIQKYDYTPTERKNAYKALGMYKEK